MTKQAAQAKFLKHAQMRGAEAAIRQINSYAFEAAGFNLWEGEKEMRQYINFGNDAVYAVVTLNRDTINRESRIEIQSWSYDSKSAKVRKMNADIVSRAQAEFEAAKAELLASL